MFAKEEKSIIDNDSTFKKVFSKNNLIFLLIFFIIGLIIYAELIIREVSNPDTLTSGYRFLARHWEVSLGRWFLVILSQLRFGLCTPIFSTLVSILIINVTTLFIFDLFNINKKLCKVIIALFLLLIPSFMVLLTYFYCSIDYNIAMLFATLIPWCLFKLKNKKIGRLSSYILLALSMGTYQAYIGVAFGLSLIYIIQKLFKCNKNEYTIKNIFKDVSLVFITMIIGFLLYALYSHLALSFFETEIATYIGANNISIKTSIINFPKSFINTYKSFFKLFFTDSIVKNSFYHREILHILLFIMIFIIILLENIKKRKFKELILQIIFVILSPVVFNLILFISTEASISILMSTSMFMIFVLLITLLDSFEIKFINCIVVIALILILLTYIISINATYRAWTLIETKTISLAGEILEKIKQLDYNTYDSRTCIIGNVKTNKLVKNEDIFKMTISPFTDIGFFWSTQRYNNVSRIWYNIYNRYFEYDINFCTYKDYSRIQNTQSFKNMSTFPNENSIKIINNIITINLRKCLSIKQRLFFAFYF